MLKQSKAVTGLIAALALMAAPAAFADAPKQAINIPAGDLARALTALAKQSGVGVVYRPEQVRGIKTDGVSGELSVEEAIAKLLEKTSLVYSTDSSGAVLVAAPRTSSTGVSTVSDAEENGLQMAQASDSAPSSEQTASTPEAAAAEVKIEEIVVTAQKRAERLQDVPASMTVISSHDIERRGITNMDDYMRGVPGVSRMETGAGRSNPIVIRGIALSPEGEKASVGTYFAETPLVSSLVAGDHFGSADVALVDMAQVEVLRGPQGTLYGSGAIGGIVRTQPVEPNLQGVEGRISTGYSETAKLGGGNYQVNAILNLPLVEDKLALRVIGYRFSDSGYINNVAATGGAGLPAYVDSARAFGATIIDEDAVGQSERDGGRVAVLWRPVEAFKLSYTFMRQLTEQTGVPEVHPGVGAYEQGYVQLDETASRQMGQDTAATINNLLLEYDFSWGQIVSSSSNITTKSRLGRDVTSALNIPLDQISASEFEEFAQEVRLTSSLKGPFQFLVGGFYEDSEVNGLATNRWSGDPSLFPFPAGAGALPLFAELPGHSAVEQQALFGEASYEITEGLTATLGARQFSYDSEATVFNVYLPAFGLNVRGPAQQLASTESGNVSKAALSYKPNADSLVYGQWSQGFRLGSPLSRPNAFCDPDGDGRIEITLADGRKLISTPGRVESDRTDNFEIGGKMSFLGGRAQINTSVYRIDWDKIPIGVISAGGTCGTTFNAGKARSQGVEIETAFRVVSGLDLQLGMSYVDAELMEDVASLGAVKGDRLPGSPRFTANAAVTYEFPLRGHQAYTRMDMLYVGEFYNNLQELGTAAGGYHQINLRSGMTFGTVDVDVYANNLTGSDELTWIYATVAADGRAFRLRPRTIGAQLTWSF